MSKTVLGPTASLQEGPEQDRSVEGWMPKLQDYVLAADERGMDGLATVERMVRKMIASRKSIPNMLKALQALAKRVRAARLADDLLQSDANLRQQQAAHMCEQLLREEAPS